MSQRFPTATYREVAKVARNLGFVFLRSGKGSHEIWRRESDSLYATIPNHGSKNFKRKTLKAILGDLHITQKEFMVLRKK